MPSEGSSNRDNDLVATNAGSGGTARPPFGAYSAFTLDANMEIQDQDCRQQQPRFCTPSSPSMGPQARSDSDEIKYLQECQTRSDSNSGSGSRSATSAFGSNEDNDASPYIKPKTPLPYKHKLGLPLDDHLARSADSNGNDPSHYYHNERKSSTVSDKSPDDVMRFLGSPGDSHPDSPRDKNDLSAPTTLATAMIASVRAQDQVKIKSGSQLAYLDNVQRRLDEKDLKQASVYNNSKSSLPDKSHTAYVYTATRDQSKLSSAVANESAMKDTTTHRDSCATESSSKYKTAHSRPSTVDYKTCDEKSTVTATSSTATYKHDIEREQEAAKKAAYPRLSASQDQTSYFDRKPKSRPSLQDDKQQQSAHQLMMQAKQVERDRCRLSDVAPQSRRPAPRLATLSGAVQAPTSSTRETLEDRKRAEALLSERSATALRMTPLVRGQSDYTTNSCDSAYSYTYAKTQANQQAAIASAVHKSKHSTSNMSNDDMAKLKAQATSGPVLAPAVSVELRPGAFSSNSSGHSSNKDMRSSTHHSTATRPSLAPATVLENEEDSDDDDDDDDDSVIEAQAGIPVLLPGAFAIEGINSGDTDSYVSESDDESVANSILQHADEENANVEVTVEPSYQPAEALAAQLHEEYIVDGAVLDDDGLENVKVTKTVRSIQVSSLCIAVIAVIVVIIGASSGLKSNNRLDPTEPVITGWQQIDTDLYGPTDEPQTYFGASLTMSADGKRLAVSAPGVDKDNVLNKGEVYVYEQIETVNGTSWDNLEVISGPGQSATAQAPVSMSSDGKRIFVGYPRLDGGGIVQIFEDTAGGYILAGTLKNNEALVDDWFGFAIDASADGNTIAIGAPLASNLDGEDQVGAVLVYQKSQGQWQQVGDTVYGSTSNELFGWSISLQTITDQTLRVAAGSSLYASERGLVRVMDWTRSQWSTTVIELDEGGRSTFLRFGESVALSANGDTLLIGARATPFERGAAYIYRYVRGEWVSDNASLRGRLNGDGFGAAVALSADGKVAVVGGPQENSIEQGNGAVVVWEYNEQLLTWSQRGSRIVTSSLGALGGAVAVSQDGSRVAIGAPYTTFDGSLSQVGSVQVYDRASDVTHTS